MNERPSLWKTQFSRRRLIAGTAVGAGAAVLSTLPPAPFAGRAHAQETNPWNGFTAPTRSYEKTYIEQNVPIRMDDGVTLRVDLWFPAHENGTKVDGRFPVIVTSHCYGKAIISAMADYSRYGYVVVVVDSRGTGASEGSFGILDEREARDAYEIVEWAGTQPFSTGKVGVDGFSYLGSSAAMTAATRPPHLAAANFGGAPTDLYRTFTTQGGNWTSSSALWFALEFLGVAPLPFSLNGNGGAIDIVPRNPTTDLTTFIGRLQADGSSIPFRLRELQRIIDETNNWDSTFWQERSTDVSRIEVPTLLYSGWADLFMRDTPRDFRALQLERGHKLMVMGPWTHYSAPKNIGVNNDQPVDDLLIGWFDHWLKGIDNGIDRLDPVLLWENGSECWTGHDAWPDQNTTYQRLYLTGDRSGTSQSVNDGSLHTTPPNNGGSDTEVIDPTNGICSRQTMQYLGGLPVYLPISFFLSTFPIKEVPNIDQIAPCFRIDDRVNEIDVLTYTTEPIQQDLTLTGPIALTLRGSTTAADPSWVARLSDVAPDGSARPVGEGALVASRRALDSARTRYDSSGDVTEPFHWHTPEAAQPVVPGAIETYNIEIWPICWKLRTGHRLRLTIDGAELPHLLPTVAYSKRFGNLTVHHDPTSPSFLSVPLSGTSFD